MDDMDEEDKKKQAAVLADIELHKDASIEAYNKRRLTIVIHEQKKLH